MPTAVELVTNLGAVLVQLPQTPASHVSFEPNNNIGGRTAVSHFLPAVQSESSLIGLLRPAMPAVTSALQKALPAVQKNIEVLGIGTSPGIIAILIGLLRSHGYHAVLGACDGSVRQGFSGPTAVLRAQGSATVAQLFLQQVAAAHAGSPYN